MTTRSKSGVLYIPKVFRALSHAQWNVAARTYGNNHATLIGLLVQWWISLSAEEHTALESGPSFEYRKRGTPGRGQCDAILCASGDPVGVLEVEGERGRYTVTKLGNFLTSSSPDLQSLQFGIIVLYPTTPFGRGPAMKFRPPCDADMLLHVADVSRMVADKAIMVVTLEKTFTRSPKGHIRARNYYYGGAATRIDGLLFIRGQQVDAVHYFAA